MSDPKIVLVTRKTRLEGLVERFNTRGQAKFYLEHSGGDFESYAAEHERYKSAVAELSSQLPRLGRFQTIERSFLPNFLFAAEDVVVTVGIDGLVVNTAKYLDGQPLVAVNPDPERIDGVLLPFGVLQAAEAVRRALQRQANLRPISMAEARLNDGQRLLAFNDLFIGVRSHVSARYAIQWGGQRENQSSSGIIVSTGAGATGWLSSLFNMANGMLSRFGPQQLPLAAPRLDWGSQALVFVVREPFISKTSAAGIVCGMVDGEHPLQVESQTGAGGVIFSDGVEADFLNFNAGAVASIGLAQRKLNLVVRQAATQG